MSGIRISGTFNPHLRGISRTSYAPQSGIIGTSAAPPSGGIWSPIIGNIRKSNSPNFIDSDELNAAVDRKFPNHQISPPVRTQLFGDELCDSYIRDINTRCKVNLTAESVNPMAPQFVNHDLSAVDALDESAGNWILATIIIRSPDITHWSAADKNLGQGVAVEVAVVDKSDYSEENYKTDFEI